MALAKATGRPLGIVLKEGAIRYSGSHGGASPGGPADTVRQAGPPAPVTPDQPGTPTRPLGIVLKVGAIRYSGGGPGGNNRHTADNGEPRLCEPPVSPVITMLHGGEVHGPTPGIVLKEGSYQV